MNKVLNNLPKEIPVFPLSNFIIFPKTTVPLNIFEPRYIEMVNDDYYAIWIDRGNLDEQSSINNNILLKHYDGTSWDDTIVIRNDFSF